MAAGDFVSKHNIDERFQALVNNASAARALSQLVEGTIGPKGLDTMLVDRFGDVAISNDGATILDMVEVSHPAARMIVNAARAQQEEVGDGTTTATIIAGALVVEGVDQVLRGVPVPRIIEGISIGINEAVRMLENAARPIDSVNDPYLAAIAQVAGRGNRELAGLVMDGARLVGEHLLRKPDYKLADTVVAREHSSSRVFNGVLLNREPLSKDMPLRLQNASILIIDDALEPEGLGQDYLKSEAGFQYYLKTREQYEANLHKICELGVKLVVVDRSIDDAAEQLFSENGIMVLQRVSSREIDRLCRHSGAHKIKRGALNRDVESIKAYLGGAELVEVDEKHQHTCIYGGRGEPWATILIGAPTGELVDELERMAKDAASAVQAALAGGIVPGGGAIEVWMAQQLEDKARSLEGLSSYGLLCVKEAILKPFCCMAANSGFNPLEKLGDVIAAQRKNNNNHLSFNSDSGYLMDVVKEGIVDPVAVKKYALAIAGEVAVAILRINTVIKRKDEELKSVNQDILE